MVRNRTPDERRNKTIPKEPDFQVMKLPRSRCSATMAVDNALWKAVITGIASNTNAAILVPQIEAWFIWKDNLESNSLPRSVLMSPLQTQPSTVCREGILYKGNISLSPWCSRRRWIDKADISTSIAVHQHTANSLKEAVKLFTAMVSIVVHWRHLP